ncbi:MAG: hypothetical protein ACOYK9_01445 [Chlamydiia bacterium]
MSKTEEKIIQGRPLEDFESTIKRAIQKIGARKENDLCKYIPMTTGGYMHHFTLKKMKRRDPKELATLIDRFILSPPSPNSIAPKQRAPRGSRKKRDLPSLNKSQIEQVIALARNANAKEILALLTPKKSLTAIKKELMSSIRNERVDETLWQSYVDAMNRD